MPAAEPRDSVHVYNARCALTVEAVQNRRGDTHTVNLECASRAHAGADFAWGDKLVVQVGGAELADVLAVVLGHLERAEFLHHGPRRDKGYRLFADGPRLVVQLFSGTGSRHSVALDRGERLRVGALLLGQLQRNHDGLGADVLHAMLVSIYTASPPAAPPSASSVVPPSVAGGERHAPTAHAPARITSLRDASRVDKSGVDREVAPGAASRPSGTGDDDAYDW